MIKHPQQSDLPRYAGGLIALLLLAWLLPGLIGHDPWKPDEAYSMGLIYHILESGDPVVPTLAGEPFMEKPPLYFLTAAGMARLFSPLLPLHDGARLASGFYMGLFLLFAGLSGRTLYGKGNGLITLLILMGCIGLVPHAHQMITDTALLAGFSMAIYGLALIRGETRQRTWVGGLLLGLGGGIGFMAKGLLLPGILAGIVFTLPLFSSQWRNRQLALSLAIATLTALPWLILWPLTLLQQSPELFRIWLWDNNFGRFFGFTQLVAPNWSGYYLLILPWYSWPALPLMGITLWQRRKAYGSPELLLPLVTGAIVLTVLLLSSSVRELYALPLLLPFSLLATPAVRDVRAFPPLFWGRLLWLLFGGLILALWLIWIVTLQATPPAWRWLAALLETNGPLFFSIPHFIPAFAATLLWCIAARHFSSSIKGLVVGWTTSLTVVWLLLMTLWLPAIDRVKSYREVVVGLTRALPDHYRCLASQGLGEPQRAMFHYFGHLLTQRRENISSTESCDLLLVQSDPRESSSALPPGDRLWQGSRPGDKQEIYSLYQMSPP